MRAIGVDIETIVGTLPLYFLFELLVSAEGFQTVLYRGFS